MGTPHDVAPASSRVAPRLTVRHRIALLVAVLAAGAGTLGLTVVPHLPGPASALHLPWIVWVAAFAVSEVLVVHIQLQRDSHSFSLTDLVLVPAPGGGRP